ncbi:amidohydrolase [Lepidopterella palustris CBS 459.81]|uniref:Amidohydrolase n=1 Tax=Lepidopterella palustris CBS 459.81 TaxID=1314670 RepID=A0A8E2E199_9PEZI|nr:amidohydrolase [Lepidopterella palustris CBS 459.81]
MTQSSNESNSRPSRTIIKGARIFDGYDFYPARPISIVGGLISDDISGGSAVEIDATGMTLLPGLIDAHVHLFSTAPLTQLIRAGVTTALDMGTMSHELRMSLRESAESGLTDTRTACLAATSAGSIHSRIPGFPAKALVSGRDGAQKFVADRVTQNADYIKIIADVPGPTQETVTALAAAAREHGKLSIAHAANSAAYAMSHEAGVDVFTHVPLDKALSDELVASIASSGSVVVPTLTMMETMSQRIPGKNYDAARSSVAALHAAGVPIIAGTDANTSPGSPAQIVHGESLHRELELLVLAGLSNVEALRAATSVAAKWFRLDDRGVIQSGKRADLLLVEGDLEKDVGSVRKVRHIWCNGIAMEFERE